MTASYNYWLVALSLAIAICASHTALDLAGRTAVARGRAWFAWLVGGAASMGLGIWSMHYIGMLAFSLPVPINYHVPTVLYSLLAAVFSSGVALFVASRSRMTWWSAAAGSVVMGGGIAAMHYTGMYAMRLHAHMSWNVGIVSLSVAIAVVVCLVALLLAFRFRSETRVVAPLKLASAVVMGIAVVAMHYTGMAGARFLPSAEPMSAASVTKTASITTLGLNSIVLVTFVVLVGATLTSLADRRITAQVLAIAQAAEEANRSKSEFLANMSHEIRTPMNGVIGMTELVLDGELTHEQRENLGIVKASANALLTVINDILDFAKIESGKLQLDPIDFDPRDTIGDTALAIGHKAHQQGLELVVDVDPAVPRLLHGDAGRLRQVLVNLIGNAVKFTPA
ncbi:MAG TPA: MHYT domain-containing protein, partial [Gemmatimonadaceae bacterium]|nr:MHYT domain-containing protein [Gemmatimonadaceae bacterium]